MPLRAELDARHDHRAVFANESIDEGHRVDRVLVAEETDRARRRWRPVQDARVARGPVFEERPSLVDEKPRALEELLAALERDLGERLGKRRRRDRHVVLYLERRLDALRWCDDPADPETGEPVDLRESACHHDALAPAAEGWALLRGALGPAVDLVGEDPRAVLVRDAHDALDLGLREDLAGRVIRLTDAYDLRARVDCGGERVEIDG